VTVAPARARCLTYGRIGCHARVRGSLHGGLAPISGAIVVGGDQGKAQLARVGGYGRRPVDLVVAQHLGDELQAQALKLSEIDVVDRARLAQPPERLVANDADEAQVH
jgi:hypothetical protein